MVRSSSCMASCVWCVCGVGGGGGRSDNSSSKHTQSIQCTIFTTAVCYRASSRSYLLPIHHPCHVTRRGRRILTKEPVRER